jgi:hypothetical protein
MTSSLQRAVRKAEKLPEPLQDQLAAQLLEDLRAEEKWDETLAASQDLLERMAQKARRARQAGKIHRRGFDQL